MVDIVDHATRSRMMSGIRSRNTKPEVLVRSLLHNRGFRFRLHGASLPGTPDIVLPRYKAVIFVHGCFWHGHDCHFFKLPKTRTEFWQNKIERNQLNDESAHEKLELSGWRVAVVWECAIRGAHKDLNAVGEKLSAWLKSDFQVLEIRSENF